jgi:hypothetical protein
LRPLIRRNVFHQTDNVLRLAVCVPEQLKLRVGNDAAAVTPNEALFTFVGVHRPLDEFRISLRPDNAFIWMDDLVPFFNVTQLFGGVAQHLMHRAVRKHCAAIDIEKADANLGILENRAE